MNPVFQLEYLCAQRLERLEHCCWPDENDTPVSWQHRAFLKPIDLRVFVCIARKWMNAREGRANAEQASECRQGNCEKRASTTMEQERRSTQLRYAHKMQRAIGCSAHPHNSISIAIQAKMHKLSQVCRVDFISYYFWACMKNSHQLCCGNVTCPCGCIKSIHTDRAYCVWHFSVSKIAILFSWMYFISLFSFFLIFSCDAISVCYCS